jgi:glycosyltransferase involved in cell wall biosynthesis
MNNSSDNNPLVSIVLPTFNRLNWLVKSIDSVLSQTYKNWELLIVDDASSDGTKEKMEELCLSDNRIKYFRIPITKEPGIAKFLNFGIETAKGKYIARLDDDDQWCNCNKLELQVNFLIANPDYVVVGGGVIAVDEKGKELFRYYENETDRDIRKNALLANPISHPTVLFRRNIAMEIGGYRKLEFAEDWDFWLRMGKKGKMFNMRNYFAYYLMANQNNSLRNQRGLAKMIFDVIKEYKDDYPNYFKGYFINSLQYLHSFAPSFFRNNTTTFLKYIKRKYF